MSMGIALEICNKVMSEVQGIKDTGFPLDAFPERVQTIILDMVRYENFKVEYLAPAMLSAVSSALGGTYYVRGERAMDNQCRTLHNHGGQTGTGQDTAS